MAKLSLSTIFIRVVLVNVNELAALGVKDRNGKPGAISEDLQWIA
jgi:hypothetical protein